jgi:hypothetical protein
MAEISLNLDLDLDDAENDDVVNALILAVSGWIELTFTWRGKSFRLTEIHKPEKEH